MRFTHNHANHAHRLLIVSLLTLLLANLTVAQTEPEQSYRAVGYYTSYSIYETETSDPYYVTDIPADNLTHLIYAHINVSQAGQCVSTDDYADTEFPYPDDETFQALRGNFNQLQILKEQNPDLTIMMSIGGWEQSEYIYDSAGTAAARQRFASSCIAFMRRYEFDGIDIDWRYPVSGGREDGNPWDYDNFPLLLEEFRTQLDAASLRDDENYELSIAAPVVPEVYTNFNLSEITLYVDFINLMGFGFAGSWSENTAHIAPLFNSARNTLQTTDDGALYTVNGTVEAFLDRGVLAEQIVLGVPLFGQAWRDVDENDFFGLYASNSGTPQGAREGGILWFEDIDVQRNSGNYVRFFDPNSQVPWLYDESRRIAISYEDEQSILAKAEYVVEMGLGGMMVWELSFDTEEHDLVSVMGNAMNVTP